MRAALKEIETVYTYEEWAREYHRRQKEDRRKRREEFLYYIRQSVFGFLMVIAGIIAPIIADGDATISLVTIPLGIYLMITKEKIMMM